MPRSQPGAQNPFFGKHHTEKTRTQISVHLKGIHRSDETKNKIRCANLAENNPNWKGCNITKGAGRGRARKILVALPKCEIHHIDNNPINNDISNLLIVTHKEHMQIHAKMRKEKEK